MVSENTHDAGAYYINIVPSAKGFTGALSEQMEQSAGVGKGVFTKIGTFGAKAFGTIGKIGLGAVTTIAGGVGMLAAKGGFDRALNIERAQVKLKALGHSTEEVQSIMDSALASVKGTAFGLGDAASIAATMVAAGVNQGDELTNILKTVADTAQISGRSLGDVGLIYSQVAAKGKLMGDDLLQLQGSGVPVLAFLAKHFNTTTEKAQKMVSKGKVSFKDFAAAMQENIGGAALASGDSFDGAMANVKSALSRLGEAFETPALNGLRNVFNALIPIIDKFTAQVKPLADQFGQLVQGKLDTVVNLLNQFSNGMDDGSITAQSLAKSLATLVGGLGILSKAPALNSFSPKILKMIGKTDKGLTLFHTTVNKKVTDIGKTLNSLGEKFDASKLGQGLKSMTDAAGKPFAAMGNAIATPFKNLGNAITTPLKSLGEQIPTPITNAFNMVGQTVGKGMNGIFNIVGKAGSNFFSILSSLFSPGSIIAAIGFGGIIAALIAGLGALDSAMGGQITVMVNNFFAQLPALLLQVTSYLQFALPGWLAAGAQLLTTIMDGITQNAPQLMNSAVAIITTLVSGLGAQLPTLVPSALNMVMALVGGLIANIPQLITSGLELIAGLVTGIANALPGLIAQAPMIITNFVSNLISGLPYMLGAAAQIIAALIRGIVTSIPALLAAAKAIPGQLMNIFRSTDWSSLGRNILDGISKGITAAAGALYSTLKNAVSGAIDGIKGFLGIHSPSRLFRDEIGKFIPLGMAAGINGEADSVAKATRDMLKIPDNLTNQYTSMFTIGGKMNIPTNTPNTAMLGKLDQLVAVQTAFYNDMGDIIADNTPIAHSRSLNRL